MWPETKKLHTHTHRQIPSCVHGKEPRGHSIIAGGRGWHWSRCLISLLLGDCCVAVSDPISALLPASLDGVRGHVWDGCLQLGWGDPTVFLGVFKNYYHHWDVIQCNQRSFNHGGDDRVSSACVEIWGRGCFFFSARKPDCRKLAANRPCTKPAKSTKSIF